MKTIINLMMVCSFLFGTTTFAQNDFKKTETFKVYGNCEMCKSNIEGSLKKKDGIYSKHWDTNTKMITLTYDSTKITLSQIHQKIANAGYDTELAKAPDDAYGKLHSCCQYERPKK